MGGQLIERGGQRWGLKSISMEKVERPFPDQARYIDRQQKLEGTKGPVNCIQGRERIWWVMSR